MRDHDLCKPAFLEALRKGGTVSGACAAIGINRSTAHRWRASDEDFATAWDEITEAVTDLLEKTAIEFALEGVEETKTVTDDSGTRQEVTRKKDPATLRFLLGARRRSTYGDKREIAHSGELTTKRVVFTDDAEAEEKEADGDE
jgi:hypothetical protein